MDPLVILRVWPGVRVWF